VIRQGEVAPSLVLVASGRLEVRADRGGAPIGIGAIGPGEHIGEAPLLSRTPSRTSVVAATEAELLLLSPRDFYDIAGAFPALWAALKESAERRTRELDARR
jgi:CRP-like cAMP-binding protein